MIKKVALITGITGQDGAYLAEYLLDLGYIVWGLKRRSSLFNTERIDHLIKEEYENNNNFNYLYGDMTDSTNLIRVIQEIQPDEIYNLAAMSHVAVSFDTPEYTANADGIGTLRILEAIKILGLEKKTKIYQASTSELYGKVQEIPQTEKTPFYPRSPYAVAKMYAYWITVNYREAYNIFASNGILFNHESPLRGETFVTRKITRAAAKIALGTQKKLYLGNLSAKRDWGHAKDYIKAMHMILQHHEADDFVISTGVATEVRVFAQKTFKEFGVELKFEGTKESEKGIISKIDRELFLQQVGINPNHLSIGQIVIEVNPRYFRPTEVDLLIGDSSKAKKLLGWEPEYTLDMTIKDMIKNDIHLMKKRKHLESGGYYVNSSIEDVI